MTDEQIHLYAVARTVVPTDTRISTLAEPVAGNGTLYTLTIWAGDQRRWFAIHSSSLRQVDDKRLAVEIAGAVSQSAATPRASARPPA